MPEKSRWVAILEVAAALAAIAVGVLLLPTVAGYGYGVLYLPVYGQLCKGTMLTGLFNNTVSIDDYRSHLLNRGCTAEGALHYVIADVNPKLDHATYIAYYKKKDMPVLPDEKIWLEIIQAQMRTFRPVNHPPPRAPMSDNERDNERVRAEAEERAKAEVDARVKDAFNECLEGSGLGLSPTYCAGKAEAERFRGPNRFCGNTMIDKACEKYVSFFERHFVSATNNGADVMADVLANPVLSSAYYLFYLVLLGFLGAIGLSIIKEFSDGKS